MAIQVAVGLSESFDAVEAFSEAAADAAAGLDGDCDLCLVFAGAPHLGHGKWILSTVHEQLSPRHLIGCGAGGVVGAGREIEEGPAAVVWAASMPEAEIETHHFEVEQADAGGYALLGVPDRALGEAMIVLADPYTFATEALLERVAELRPGMPVLGGLASAAAAGSASLFRDGDVVNGGAVACSLSGVPVLPCVSQGAAPVGPEMTVTAGRGNVIDELASQPAISRLEAAIAELDVRDGASADEDLRAILRAQIDTLGSTRPAGALLFTCNGRGAHMFQVPDHDASAIEDALGVPAGGFFCAGEIGPVGGRNFLHGFTATMALFPAE